MKTLPWLNRAPAPNGRPVNVNFHSWFKNSKVVDMHGDPLIAFHGSWKDDIAVFSAPGSQWVGPGMNDVQDTHILHFTDNKKTALSYGKNLYQVYLSILNPLELDATGERWSIFHPAGYWSQALQDGHDGIIIKNLRDDATGNGASATTFVAFSPSQVKSAMENNGNFDIDSEAISDEDVPDADRYDRYERMSPA